MGPYMWIFWLIAAIVFLLIELATVSMVSLWFVAGSLAAMLAAFGGLAVGWPIALILLVSLLLLFVFMKLRPKLGILPSQRKPTNADRLIGKEALVIKDIDPVKGTGQVRVQGQIWSARSADDESIVPEGTKVMIQDIRGVKLVVEEIKEA